MSDQHPEAVWAFPPERPKRTGRIWLIVLLSIAAVAIAAILVFFLVPRDGAPGAAPTDTPSPSTSPSATSTPTPTPTATDAPPPAPADPDLETFRTDVEPWLNDALTGLTMIFGTSGQDALQIVEQLQEDFQRLSDAAAPNSIVTQWRDGIDVYSTRLNELHTAVESGSGVSGASDAARTAVTSLLALLDA